MANPKNEATIRCLRKNYVRFSLDFKPDVLAEFRAACEKNGVSPTSVIKKAVAAYIAANDDPEALD